MRLTLVFVLTISIAFARADERPAPKVLFKPDAFQTLVNPNCSHCIDESKRRSSELRDDDRVLAWTRGKYDGGAIPIRFFLNPYRVISDTYGTFVYDPDAGYARAFKASLDFRFHGWRNGVMVMKHKDGTLFSSLSGLAFDGPRKGERLESWPTIVTDWGWWLKNYKDTVAYHMYEKYKPTELPIDSNPDSATTRGQDEPRLPADAMVLGIWNGKEALAVPLAQFEKAGTSVVGEENWIVLWYGPTRTAAAYQTVAEKREKTDKLGVQGPLSAKMSIRLRADGLANRSAGFIEDSQKSRWDIAGRCIEGDYKGWTLAPLDSVMVKWFAWSAEYPETKVYGQK